MSNLSKREKFLLFLMTLIVPVALIYSMLIAPLNETLASKKDLVATLETQKQQLEINLSAVPSLRVRREARAQEVSSILENFSSPIHASEFERWMLPLFAKYNVKVEAAIFSPTQISTPVLNMEVITPQIYELLALIQEFNTIQAPTVVSLPTTTTQLLFAEYEYRFKTSMQSYLNIIDEVNSWETTFIISKASYIADDNFASLTLQIYSVEKLTPEQMLEIYKGDFGIHPNETTDPNIPKNPK